MTYPTLESVEGADLFQLGTWMRFLPSPGLGHVRSDDFATAWRIECRVLDRITDRFKELGGWSPELSKAVGV